MAVFLTGIVAFLFLATAIGLVYYFLVKAAVGRDFKVSPRPFILTLLVPIAIGVIVLGVGAFLEYHESPEFCGELCHAMEPHYEGYVNPENNSMMIVHSEHGVSCTGCHVGPGWYGQVEAYYAVPHEIYSEIFDTYDPDDLGGHLKEESCLKCHDNETAPVPGAVIDVLGNSIDPHLGDPVCMDCHPAHSAGFGVSLETCELCHGHAVYDWDDAMSRHGNRTGGDCLDCHDRDHPDDAMVPWSKVEDIIDMEFCHDCHPVEWLAYNQSSNNASLTLYGDCLDCHSEHLSTEAFHPHDPPYDECGVCHINYTTTPGGIHNRTDIFFGNHTEVGNDLCMPCHPDEEAGLDEKKNHRGLECAYSHRDHRQRVVVFFLNDTGTTEISTWHTNEADCISSRCHGTRWYH
jgi:nitrate/TMAO reductase-like tetraheme cytochrome c subunit